MMESDRAENAASVRNATIRSHRDLIAWQRAYELGLGVYAATTAFPDSERFGLTSQLRRCAVSIASNIAEGYGRGSTQDYLRFLRVARGSLCELDTQLQFASDLGFLKPDTGEHLVGQILTAEKLLAGLIRGVERSAR